MSTRIIDPNDPNKKKSTDETAPASQPLSVTQGGTGGGTATTTTGQPQQSQQQQQAPSSGSFTDLGKYKQAAQNAGNRIAEGVQSKFATKTRQGESALKDTSRQFTQAMDTSSGYAATEEGRAGAITNVGNYTAGQAGYQQPPTSPVNNANPNFTQNDFADVVNRQYTGVRRADEVDAYQQAVSRSQAIKDYAKLINDPNRNADLLRNTFGQDQQYSQGMNRLDSYLYNKSGAASNIKASDQFKNAQNFDQRIDQTKTELSGLAKARAEAIDKMRNDARQAFTDVAQGRTKQIEDRLDNVKSEWDSLTNMLRDEFYEPGTAGQPGNDLYREGREIITREFEPDTLSRMSGQQAYDYANKHYQTYTNEISDLEAKLKDPRWGISPGRLNMFKQRKDAEARLAQVKTLKQQAYDAMAGVTGTGRKLKTDGAELSPLAMALLGVGQNTQLFHTIKDEESLNNLIKSREYERDRLIGKGEQANLARLEALSKLASAPGTNMDYTNKYFDAKRAGTLTASDSLDRENVANKLNEAMEQFRTDSEKDITTTGWGHDRFKRPGRKSGDIWRYASATGSLDDVLNKAGYKYQQNLADPNISNSDIAEMVNLFNQYDKKDPILSAMKSDWESITDLGSWTGKDTLREGWYQGANFINDLGNKLGILGDLSGLDALGSVLQDFGRAFGSDKGAKAEAAQQRAQEMANKNLVNELNKQLQNSGFYNTIKQGDVNDSKIKARQQALIDLLLKLDSTNRGSY